jgi:hypothetical protein
METSLKAITELPELVVDPFILNKLLEIEILMPSLVWLDQRVELIELRESVTVVEKRKPQESDNTRNTRMRNPSLPKCYTHN